MRWFLVEPAPKVEQLQIHAKLFRGLGDPTRLRILECLLEGDRNVGQLVALLGLQQGRVSSHLACLKWCGLVSSYRDGKNVYYRVADGRVRQLLALARGLAADNAERIASCTRIDEGTGDGSVLSNQVASED